MNQAMYFFLLVYENLTQFKHQFLIQYNILGATDVTSFKAWPLHNTSLISDINYKINNCHKSPKSEIDHVVCHTERNWQRGMGKGLKRAAQIRKFVRCVLTEIRHRHFNLKKIWDQSLYFNLKLNGIVYYRQNL